MSKGLNIEYAKKRENFRKTPYHCPAGHLTLWYGCNLESNILEKAETMLEFCMDMADRDLKTSLPDYEYFPDFVQFVLRDMCFNMGIGRLLLFKKMLRRAIDRDWQAMADELVDSKYYQQTGIRAKNNENILRTGKIEVI